MSCPTSCLHRTEGQTDGTACLNETVHERALPWYVNEGNERCIVVSVRSSHTWSGCSCMHTLVVLRWCLCAVSWLRQGRDTRTDRLPIVKPSCSSNKGVGTEQKERCGYNVIRNCLSMEMRVTEGTESLMRGRWIACLLSQWRSRKLRLNTRVVCQR